MALVQTEAIVLRSYNLAEADRIVVCLTRSAGLVRGVAKGARRLKSRFGAALEPFTLIALSFYEKENRELVSFSQTEILKSHFNLSANPEIANALAYMGELLVEFAAPHEGDEKLFRMVSACLNAIAASQEDSQTILRYFEVWLLRLAGFLPDLRSCTECRAPLAGREVYLNAEARPRCSDCSRGAGAVLFEETRESILATQRLSPTDFATATRSVPERGREQLRDIIHRLLVNALERRPRVSSSWLQPDPVLPKTNSATAGQSELS
jgi:DNA repair protein RecO (recombination protein O)